MHMRHVIRVGIHWSVALFLLLSVGVSVSCSRTDLADDEAAALKEARAHIEAGGDVNVSNDVGETLLFMAAQDGHAEVVQMLLTATADVNAARMTDGVTPLFMAAQDGHTEVVQLLLAAGADVNVEAYFDDVMHTPMGDAKKNGHLRIVDLLREHGVRE